MTSIGFHVSVGGNRTGIGQHFQALDAAGIPVFLVSIGDYGPINEVVLLARASGIDHRLVFRVTDLDVPNYGLDPATAALNHWTAVKAKLPPEFDKQRVWLCPINEVDKNRADWLGHFATNFAASALGEGYKVTMFGWSSGEPEPEHWQTAGMRRYLELCAANPNKAAVALHEYSYTIENLNIGYPSLIGRFQSLFAACDQMGITRPTVHITEFGWTHEEVPTPDVAMPQLDWAYKLYTPYPQIKGVAIWGLISGFGGIANLAQKLITPVTEYMLNAPDVDPIEPPPIDPEPPPSEETLTEYLWRISVEQQPISLNPKAALQNAIFTAGFVPVESEIWTVYDGIEYALQAGERLSDGARRVWYCRVPEWNNIQWAADPGTAVPPVDPPPGNSVNMLPYFAPVNGQYGDIVILKNNWGEGDERQQLQQSGSNLFVTKNASFEQRVIRTTTIDLVLDTSRGNGEMYTVSGPWIPKQMAIGQSFTRTETIQVKRKDNCQNVGNPYTSTSQIKFVAKYNSLPIEGGVTIQDVVELHWILNGVVEERYFYGRHKGLCQWLPKDGRRSWAVEIVPLGQQHNNEMEEIPCL